MVKLKKMERIKVTQVKSQIGCLQNQKRTLRALGLRKINQTVEHEKTATITGMVNTVKHLVSLEVT